MSDRLWTQCADWVGTEIDGSFVMVSVESGKYVALNETAHAIWTALETPRDDNAVLQYLRESYDIEGHDSDALEALEDMRTKGLIEPAESVG